MVKTLRFNPLAIQKTNIPNIRLAYRYQTLMEERCMVYGQPMGMGERSSTEESDEDFPDEILEAPSAKLFISEPLLNSPQLSGKSPTLNSKNVLPKDDANAPFLELTPPVIPTIRGATVAKK